MKQGRGRTLAWRGVLTVGIAIGLIGGVAAPAGAYSSWDLEWGSFSDTLTVGQPANYKFPRDVVVGPTNGLVYVAQGSDTERNRIIVSNQSGAFVSYWGNDIVQNSNTANGKFDDPQGIAAAANGDIFVADTSNDRIQKFGSGGNHLLTFGTSGTGSGQLASPMDVAVDSSGNIYVADRTNIEKYDSAGIWQTAFVTPSDYLSGIAIGPGDVIYVSGGVFGEDHVYKYDTSGNLLDTLGTGLTADGPGDLNAPHGLSVDPQGRVFVAEEHNYRISVFDSNGDYIERFGEFGANPPQMAATTGVDISGGKVFITEWHKMDRWTWSGSAPPPPTPKPDGQIALAAAGPYVGNNVYQAVPTAAQTKSRTVARTRTGVFYAKVQNDRPIADSFKLKGSAAPAGFTFRYYKGATAVEISTAVKAGTFTTPAIAPGGSYLVRIVMGVGATTAHGLTKSATLTARSVANAAKLDAVKASTTVA